MKIKEIFYTLQGEGRNWGMPSVFVRTGQCNLRCDFCDTDYLNDLKEMPVEEVAAEIVSVAGTCRSIVFTGGEPLLWQDDLVALMLTLTQQDYRWFFAVETNGTIQPSTGFFRLIDWICCSPKLPTGIKLTTAHEVKMVYTEDYKNHLHQVLSHFRNCAPVFYISPEAPSDNPYARNEVKADKGLYPHQTNVQEVVNYVKENPSWRLNLQTHKILGIR